jgi:hypothetical protein
MWKVQVIDADAHMHEAQYLWERYVEPDGTIIRKPEPQ